MADGRGKHPNTLANLTKIGDRETAEHMRKKGLETRRRKKAEREAMAAAVEAYKKLQLDLPPAVEVLRIAMAKAMVEEDMDEMTRVATLLAPYETPKLASKEVNITENMRDKSDDELKSLAKELGVEIKDELH